MISRLRLQQQRCSSHMHHSTPPTSQPARVTLQGERLSSHAPALDTLVQSPFSNTDQIYSINNQIKGEFEELQKLIGRCI
jgi:hypothetical protein